MEDFFVYRGSPLLGDQLCRHKIFCNPFPWSLYVTEVYASRRNLFQSRSNLIVPFPAMGVRLVVRFLGSQITWV